MSETIPAPMKTARAKPIRTKVRFMRTG
jgi:hypothetical protein